MRYFARIRYVGTHFSGFQVQRNQRTVQGELGAAAEKLFGCPCGITGCSRTDSGVHANMFCVAVTKKGTDSLETGIPIEALPRALATYLPEDISVFAAEAVEDDFHPRYDVHHKEYVYRIWNRPARNPFLRERAWHCPRPIDDEGVVRDCTLYKDTDGSAYFIYDRDETFDLPTRCIHIVKLTDDYLLPTDEYKRIAPCYRREAPAVIYHGGYYYMITSDMTAWEANKAKYFRAKSLLGEWEDMGDPYTDDFEGNSFMSQTTYAFNIEGTDRFIHMAERHNKENFLHDSYIWLPIDFDDEGRLSMTYREEWSI